MSVDLNAIIARATGNGTYQVTRNQLLTSYFQAAGQSGKQGCFRVIVALGFLLVGGPMAVIGGSQTGAAFAVIAAGVLLSWNMWPGASKETFDKLLDEYLRTGGQIPGLLPPHAIATPPPGAPEPDIYAYGVQRILITDDDAVVDLLVRNNFHAQHQIAITSINGYPNYLAPVIQKALTNPQLKIYLVHGAESSSGAGFYHRVANDPRIGHRGQNILNCGFTHENVNAVPALAAVPSNLKKSLPVDMVPYDALAALLAQAIGQHQSITQILNAQAAAKRAASRASSGSTSSGFFSGGGYDFG